MRLNLNYFPGMSGSPRIGKQADDPRSPARVVRPSIDVQALLQGHSEVRLLHHGTEYRLRLTRQGKLILTK